MTKKYKICVIIPTFNRAKLLEESLNSLFMQTLPKSEYQVIIIDDGSTDNTNAVVNTFKEKLNIEYIYQEKNGYGVAKARNTGILSSSSDICVFLDCGILIASNALEEHIKTHSSNSNLAVLGLIYGFDEYNENCDVLENLGIDSLNTDKYIEILENLNLLDLREPTFKKLGYDLKKWPAPWAIFYTGYLSIKKDTIMKVGLFDETFTSWGFEDIDFGLLMFVNKVEIILNKSLKSIHLPHEKSREIVGEDNMRKKKRILHDKYNLKETELYIDTINGRVMNELLSNITDKNNS